MKSVTYQPEKDKPQINTATSNKKQRTNSSSKTVTRWENAIGHPSGTFPVHDPPNTYLRYGHSDHANSCIFSWLLI